MVQWGLMKAPGWLGALIQDAADRRRAAYYKLLKFGVPADDLRTLVCADEKQEARAIDQLARKWRRRLRAIYPNCKT